MFVISAFSVFKIKTHGEVKVNLFDNSGYKIPKERLCQHIQAFWRNETFSVRLTYEGDPKSSDDTLITPHVMKIQLYCL